MRHLLLILLPAALLAQDINTEPTTGTTTLVIRGDIRSQGSTPLTTSHNGNQIWQSNDGKAFTQGINGYLVPYHGLSVSRPPKWTYAAYGVAVGADYLSTRYALSHGATDALYRCSPHRAGCMNQGLFWGVAAIPVGMWLLNDLWLHKRTSPQWQRFANFGRKLVIGGRFGVAAYNVGIANGIKGGRNGK